MKEKTKDLLRMLAVSGGVGALAGLCDILFRATHGTNVPALDLMKGFGQNFLYFGAMPVVGCFLINRLEK